jgi:hypothetical protein
MPAVLLGVVNYLIRMLENSFGERLGDLSWIFVNDILKIFVEKY